MCTLSSQYTKLSTSLMWAELVSLLAYMRVVGKLCFCLSKLCGDGLNFLFGH